MQVYLLSTYGAVVSSVGLYTFALFTIPYACNMKQCMDGGFINLTDYITFLFSNDLSYHFTLAFRLERLLHTPHINFNKKKTQYILILNYSYRTSKFMFYGLDFKTFL